MKHPALIRAIYWMALILIATPHGIVMAQECNPLSFMSQRIELATYSDKLAFINEITSENWASRRRDIAAGITLPFDVPVAAQADFHSFETWRRDYFSHIDYKRSVKQDYVFHEASFDPRALPGYLACLATTSRISHAGLSAYASFNGSIAKIHVLWSPGPKLSGSEPDTAAVQISSIGAKSNLNQNYVMTRDGEAISTLQLRENEPVTVTANISGVPGVQASAVDVDLLLPIACRGIDVQRFAKTQWSTGYGDGHGENRLAPWASTWRAHLESKGFKNVHVTYKGKDHEDSKSTKWPNGGWKYNYTGNYEATYIETIPGPGCYGKPVGVQD